VTPADLADLLQDHRVLRLLAERGPGRVRVAADRSRLLERPTRSRALAITPSNLAMPSWPKRLGQTRVSWPVGLAEALAQADGIAYRRGGPGRALYNMRLQASGAGQNR